MGGNIPGNIPGVSLHGKMFGVNVSSVPIAELMGSLAADTAWTDQTHGSPVIDMRRGGGGGGPPIAKPIGVMMMVLALLVRT